MMIDHVTVYGASSANIDGRFIEDARRVGSLLAARGVTVVNGGGRTGLMGATIEGAREQGGQAIGVLPQFMLDRQWQHPDLTAVIAEPDMHARKSRMAALSGAVIALPGGVGTLEELLEIITWRKLDLYEGNVVILNTMGYYDPLVEMLHRTVDLHFMKQSHVALWSVASTPDEAVDLALGSDGNGISAC